MGVYFEGKKLLFCQKRVEIMSLEYESMKYFV